LAKMFDSVSYSLSVIPFHGGLAPSNSELKGGTPLDIANEDLLRAVKNKNMYRPHLFKYLEKNKLL